LRRYPSILAKKKLDFWGGFVFVLHDLRIEIEISLYRQWLLTKSETTELPQRGEID
jgi:hypothetical protein